jgi:hypothetical protein
MDKYCKKCDQTKSITEFAKMTAAKDGLQYICKKCHRAENKRISDKYKHFGPKTFRNDKVCNDCNVRKPINQFFVRRANSDGYGSYCKPCWNIRVKKSQSKAKKK